MTKTISTPTNEGVLGISIKINGKDGLNNFILSEINIQKYLAKTDSCKIKITPINDIFLEEFNKKHLPNFKDNLEIYAGYEDKLKLIFSGNISEIVFLCDTNEVYYDINCESKSLIKTNTETVLKLTYGLDIISCKLHLKSDEYPFSCNGNVQFQGFGDIYPGNLIDINYTADSFRGIYEISSLSHKIIEGQWTTSAEIIR